MTRIIGPIAWQLPDDHPVSEIGSPLPRIAIATRMKPGRVKECLRGHAGPERARATEQLTVDDRDGGASSPGEMRRRLAGLAGTDDDEVVSIVHERRASSIQRRSGRPCRPVLVR